MTQGPIVGTDGSISAYYVSGNLAWKITTDGGFVAYEDAIGPLKTVVLTNSYFSMQDGYSKNLQTSSYLAIDNGSFGPPAFGANQNLLSLENSTAIINAFVSSSGNLSIGNPNSVSGYNWLMSLAPTSGTNSAWTVGTWQTPATFLGTFSSGSSASATYKGLRYKIDSDDNLVLFGAVHTTALAAGVHNIFTLPSGSVYIPQDNSNPGTFIHTRSNDALVADTTRINVNPTSGNVTIVNTAAFLAGDNLYINITVPLGNLS